MTKHLRDEDLDTIAGARAADLEFVSIQDKVDLGISLKPSPPTPGGQDEPVAEGQQTGGPTELSQLP